MKRYKAKIYFVGYGNLNLVFIESDLKNPAGQILFWSTKYDLAYTESTLLNIYNAKLLD